MTKRLDITEDTHGQRADKVVSDAYPLHARSAVHKLFENGSVLMDGQALKAGYKVRTGETIFVEDELLVQEPENIDLEVLYEDDDVVVINKPVGILSHNRGSFSPEATVASWLRKHTKQLIADGGTRAGIVHRLDRATSGVMICAKSEQSQTWLQKQFSQRLVRKTYSAIVEGQLPTDEGLIDMPIGRNPAKPTTFMASQTGKPATTRYRVVQQSAHFSLLELSPETGRTHQLRVHLATLGHPIVNDPFYGKPQPTITKPVKARPGPHTTPHPSYKAGDTPDRLMLHAHMLELTLPSGQHKTFTAPLPPLFAKALKTDS